MTTGCPHLACSLSPTMRASTSLMPPPGNGTMNFTVRVGNAGCAVAALTASAPNRAIHASAVRLIGCSMSWSASRAPSSRLIAAAERGLTLAEPGKLPHAGAAGVLVGTDIGVDEIGPARRERRAQCVGQVGGA